MYSKRTYMRKSFLLHKKTGNVLFSLTLSSALKCLTAVFEMETGVSTSLSSPIKYREIILWKHDNTVLIKLIGLNSRSISTSQLNISLCFHV